MKRTYSTNGIVVFSFIVISIAVLAAGLLMFFTDVEIKLAVPKASSNIIQTPRPTILPSVYPACVGFGEDKKWGLIDKTGKFVVKPKYDEIMDFQDNGYAIVTKFQFINGQYYSPLYGLIDSKGKEVLSQKYSGISEFSDGLCSLSIEGEKIITVINEKLEIVFTLKADSIGNFNDGIAVFRRIQKDGTILDGFVDSRGGIILQPTLDYVDNVFGERAYVKNFQAGDSTINLHGNQTIYLSQFQTAYLGDGLLSFQRGETAEKYGVLDMYGLVLVDTKYDSIDNFYDGFALVRNYDMNGKDEIGLINSKGKIVIPLKEYKGRGLQNYGDGLLGIYKELSGAPEDSDYAKNAFMDLTGKRLTEFRFYNVTIDSDGIYSVSDGVYTFFVDKSGRELKNLPKVLGVGRISRIGDLYKCDVDGILSYLDDKGKLVWKENLIQKISNGITAKTEVYRRGYLGVARYPVFSGIGSHEVESKINSQIYKLFAESLIAKDYPNEESIELDYGAEITGSVLTVHLFGYDYPVGAPHGNTIDIEMHFSLLDGKKLTIQNLFEPGTDFEYRLDQLIKKQAIKEKKFLKPASITMGGKDTLFNVTKNSLMITFMPYEIDTVDGEMMPTFEIKFSEIDNTIDKNGAFWKALTTKRNRS